MSRIGKIPVVVPKEVKVAMDATSISLEGPKGKLSLRIPHNIKIEQGDGTLVVKKLTDVKQTRADFGTTRALLNNMVQGITQGHKKELEIQGIGFRVQAQGNKLVFSLGFSHPVEFEVPSELTVATPSQTAIVLEGIDKELVGQIAAKIRNLKKPEPYKGKGIRYAGEVIKMKQGKSVTK